MQTADPKTRPGPLPTVAFRISHQAKAALERRAELRSEAEGRTIRPGRVGRELLEYALNVTDETHGDTDVEDLIDDVLSSALFARRALELLLSEHRELTEKLLRACRKEVQRRKRGWKLLRGMR